MSSHTAVSLQKIDTLTPESAPVQTTDSLFIWSGPSGVVTTIPYVETAPLSLPTWLGSSPGGTPGTAQFSFGRRLQPLGSSLLLFVFFLFVGLYQGRKATVIGQEGWACWNEPKWSRETGGEPQTGRSVSRCRQTRVQFQADHQMALTHQCQDWSMPFSTSGFYKISLGTSQSFVMCHLHPCLPLASLDLLQIGR